MLNPPRRIRFGHFCFVQPLFWCKVWAGNFSQSCDIWPGNHKCHMNIVNNDSLRRSLGRHHVKLVTTLLHRSCGVMLFFMLSGTYPFMAKRIEARIVGLKKKLVPFEQLCWVSLLCAGCVRLETYVSYQGILILFFIPVIFQSWEDWQTNQEYNQQLVETFALFRSSQLLWPKSLGNLISRMAWGLKALDVQRVLQHSSSKISKISVYESQELAGLIYGQCSVVVPFWRVVHIPHRQVWQSHVVLRPDWSRIGGASSEAQYICFDMLRVDPQLQDCFAGRW